MMLTVTDFGSLEQATVFADWAARTPGSRRSLTCGAPAANPLSAAATMVITWRA